MDVIITAIGKFIWTSSCAIVNFYLSSGLNALIVFVSFLSAILASVFYKYTNSRERLLLNDDKSVTAICSPIKTSIRSPPLLTETTNSINTNNMSPLSEIEISIDQNTSENKDNNEQISNDMIIDTIEDSDEEIQTKQLENIYHILDDNNLTNMDFINQLKMYGFQIDNETELELS